MPAGVSLTGSYVYLKVPSSPSDPPVEFTYGDTDGATPSLAQVIVHAGRWREDPADRQRRRGPAAAAGAATVTVNVLKNDDDPVGSPGDLKISWVPAGVTVHGQSLTIKLAAQPREVPYQVTAPDGLTATAVVYVPGTQATAIRLRPGARIVLKKDGSATVPLSSVLDRHLRPAAQDHDASTSSAASPGGDLTVTANQATAFQVHALGGYTGPGAVTVQVYDGATMQDPHGNTATVTIPAQVGPDVPILRCPQDPLQVVEGGAPLSYDIGQLCHVWVDTTVPAPALRYSTCPGPRRPAGSAPACPAAPPAADRRERRRPWQHRDAADHPGGRDHGRHAQRRGHQGAAADRARGQRLGQGRARASRSTSASTSPARSRRPDIQVLNVTHPAGATVTSSGSTVTITPAHDTTGTLTLTAGVTDVAGPDRPGDPGRDHRHRHRLPGRARPADRDGGEPQHHGVVRRRPAATARASTTTPSTPTAPRTSAPAPRARSPG